MPRWLWPLLALLLCLCPDAARAAEACEPAAEAAAPEVVRAAAAAGDQHAQRASGAEELLRRVDTRAPTPDARAGGARPAAPLAAAAPAAAPLVRCPAAGSPPAPRTCERLPYHAAAPPRR